jgi:hypothetical protein
MMEIPAGKYCDEPFKKGMVCAFFLDACLFPDDRAEEPVVVRQSIEDGTETAYERCPSCLSAYPHGATITITAKGE